MGFKVRIILDQTSHPGNIGATARAMKTMGFDALTLVAPKQFPCAEATARAAGADDILANAKVVETLDEAIADVGFLVATSARNRELDWQGGDLRRTAREIATHQADPLPVGILFGQERSGLSNEALQKCHWHLTIPTSAEYASLNLAQAVQLVTYECRMALMESPAQAPRDLASGGAMQGLYQHLEEALASIGFLDRGTPKLLMTRLRRLLARAQVDTVEYNILRGICKTILQPRA